YKMTMNMRHPFTTSFGTQQLREFALVEVKSDNGITGWGECVTMKEPLYIEEFTDASLLMLEKFLIPIVLNNDIEHPDDLEKLFKPFKRNHLAKSSIEGAIWDLYAKENNLSLAQVLGGKKSSIEVGISLGIEKNINDLLTNIQERVDENYRRIKVKIAPGKDIQIVDSIRQKFPDISLMVDANSAYTLKDVETLKKLDQFNLMMIEQP
ncbi:o-succinylbenzoate synthase, partial [Microvirga sp. 3-52]|nr:o-succinylbenzoate synthase [Microvirga sp. 3-52]